MTDPLRAIVAYKTVKAALQLSAALLLLICWPLGLPHALTQLSHWLHRGATHAWAARLSDALLGASIHRRLALAAVALTADGALTALEAWSLRRGRWWGPWLVVAATSLLLPFELYELVRAPRASRALLLLINALIVAYLAQRAWRERGRGARRFDPR